MLPGEPNFMNAASRILVALDTDTAEKALRLAEQVSGEVAGFKVGLELVNAAGFGLFHDLKALAGPDARLFYDCKFHDIPNTVAGASRARRVAACGCSTSTLPAGAPC